MTIWIGIALALVQGARFIDWPPDGAVGTALVDSVGCRSSEPSGMRLFEDGYAALMDGNSDRAQLIFARGVADGICRTFTIGEQVVRQTPGWFFMNASPTDALPPLALWEAICARPIADTDADPLDCYHIVADLFHFPKDAPAPIEAPMALDCDAAAQAMEEARQDVLDWNRTARARGMTFAQRNPRRLELVAIYDARFDEWYEACGI